MRLTAAHEDHAQPRGSSPAPRQACSGFACRHQGPGQGAWPRAGAPGNRTSRTAWASWTRRSISRVLSPAMRRMDGHSSGPFLAERFSRPTRTSQAGNGPASRSWRNVPIWSCSRRGLPCRPRCRVRGGLLPHPFTLPATPKRGGGLLSVALSLGSLPAGVVRRLVSVEPGLSSTFLQRPRPSNRLVRAHKGRIGPSGQARALRISTEIG